MDEEDSDEYQSSWRARLDKAWFYGTHPVDLPDPVVEDPEELDERCDIDTPDRTHWRPPATGTFKLTASDIKKTGFFNGTSHVQVIFKLVSIHLTPERTYYKGGAWHVEGQLNEHICATTLFYYDSDNTTESRLEFRTSAKAEDLLTQLGYEQNDIYSIERTVAIRADDQDNNLQNIGLVLTRQGRAVFFPNLYQHRVEPFRLADRSRPGHRKILALFLVDPTIPVISTANVPPAAEALVV